MLIQKIMSQIAFQANYYQLNTAQNQVSVITDEEIENPYFYRRNGAQQTGPMYPYPVSLNGKKCWFSPSVHGTHDVRYKIYDSTTLKTADGSEPEEYCCDSNTLSSMATQMDKEEHGQPLMNSLKKGVAEGLVLYEQDWEKIHKFAQENPQTPIIVMTSGGFKGFDDTLESNIVGLIMKKTSLTGLCHETQAIKDNTLAAAILYDPDDIEKIESLNGQYARVKVEQGSFSAESIKGAQLPEKSNGAAGEAKPKYHSLQYCDKLLSPEEYTKQNVGAKAYSLAVLERMVKEGKLQDVIVPKSFAISHGFIDKMQQENTSWQAGPRQTYEQIVSKKELSSADVSALRDNFSAALTDISELPTFKDVIDKIEEMQMSENLIARSAFNDEDIEGHSAAGLYDSFGFKYLPNKRMILKNAYLSIMSVAASKWNKQAFISRTREGIEHSEIKPTVIIQEKTEPDYTFTIYTKNKNNNLLFEISSSSASKTPEYKLSTDALIAEYDRKTGEIELISKERLGQTIIFDEQGHVVRKTPNEESQINENFDSLKPLLKKVAQNALAVEKEFDSKPQDIEGGIKDGRIYFWQARNIVEI